MLLTTNFLKPNDGILFYILFIYYFLVFANTKKSFLMESLNLSFLTAKSITQQSVYLIISETMQYIKTC